MKTVTFSEWAMPEKVVIYNGEAWDLRGIYDIGGPALIALQRDGNVEFYDMETVLLEGVFCASKEVAAKVLTDE